jgi:hemerythrin-like metal-binding protein
MSEHLVWRPSWDLGIEVIDADHREMVRLINRLSDPADPAGLSDRLLDLITHLRRHFHDEEVFLESIRYPQAAEHAREHHVQLAELVALRRMLEGSSAILLDPAEVRGIKDWFFNHVIAEDRRFAVYYRRIGGCTEGDA